MVEGSITAEGRPKRSDLMEQTFPIRVNAHRRNLCLEPHKKPGSCEPCAHPQRPGSCGEIQSGCSTGVWIFKTCHRISDQNGLTRDTPRSATTTGARIG